MTSPLVLHAAPAAGFDQPFEMLAACHQRVQRMLALLARLADHLASHGSDADARQAALDVMRYFDQAGPAHHEDEERHVFPALLAGGQADAQALVARLQADHADMARQWLVVRADLSAVAAGWPPPAGLVAARGRWAAFGTLYDGHITAEEGLAYPAAQAVLGLADQQRMGTEMARRRGAPAPAG